MIKKLIGMYESGSITGYAILPEPPASGAR
jgi:hypothetical protein